MAEEFAFEELARNRCAIDADERAPRLGRSWIARAIALPMPDSPWISTVAAVSAAVPPARRCEAPDCCR
jgi:hypothetical protein